MRPSWSPGLQLARWQRLELPVPRAQVSRDAGGNPFLRRGGVEGSEGPFTRPLPGEPYLPGGSQRGERRWRALRHGARGRHAPGPTTLSHHRGQLRTCGPAVGRQAGRRHPEIEKIPQAAAGLDMHIECTDAKECMDARCCGTDLLHGSSLARAIPTHAAGGPLGRLEEMFP